MERYESIIRNGRISNITARIHIWGIPIVILLGSLGGIYNIFTTNSIPSGETEYFQSKTNFILTVIFSLFIVFSIFLLARGERILKTVFLKDSRSIDDKESAIEKLMLSYNWDLSKRDKNYYKFWENNFIFIDYEITIVFDENGFYVNTCPTYEILDFGDCRKKSERICGSLKTIHNIR